MLVILCCAILGWSLAVRADGLAKLCARMRAQDPVGALRAFAALSSSHQQRPAAAYAHARVLSELGRYAAAARALPKEPTGMPAEVWEDLQVYRARLWARSGRYGQALEAATELAAAGVRSPAMYALAGECLLALDRAQEAVDMFAKVRGKRLGRDVEGFVLALHHAEALRRAGRVKDAAAKLQGALDGAPGHSLAGIASAQLSELGVSGSLSPTQRVERALVLLKAGRSEEAVKLLFEVPVPRSRGERAKLYFHRGMALFRVRTRYPDAAKWLARAAAAGGPDAEEAAFYAARALSRANRDRQAVRAYRRFARRHRTSRFAPQAEYLAAWLSLRHGFAGAEQAMRRFLDGRAGKRAPGSRASGLFELGRRLFERKRFSDAEDLFQRYSRTGAGAMVRARGLYWAGRAAQEEAEHRKKQRLANRKRAVVHYRAAYRVEPLHYYALLARLRSLELGEPEKGPFEARTEEAPKEPKPSGRDDGETVAAAALPPPVAFYASIGLDRDAAVALQRDERAYRGAGPGELGLRRLVAAYQSLGAVVRPFHLVAREARGLYRRPAVGPDRVLWKALFPRPYPEAVAGLAREFRLDADLIYALIRKESAYDPNVVSRADALGLMQLLPATAEKYAAQEGLPFERARLFEPSYNLRLGSAYVRKLLREFGGQAPLAIAAYNAGEHRVRAWLKAAKGQGSSIPLDLFVERIPIEQTRNYVRRVLANWARYRYMSGGEPAEAWPPITLTLKR